VLDRPGKTSRRLEWVCAVYAQITRQALPRLRPEEWIWLTEILAELDVRSIDHLALLPERVRSTAGGARGVDNLGVATRLSGLSLAGKAAVWDLVTQVAQARESAGRPLTAEEVIGTLPPEALLR